MEHQILWGILSIIAGIFVLFYTFKFPFKGNDIFLINLKGYFGGVGFIIIGIMATCDKIGVEFVRNAWFWIIVSFLSSSGIFYYTFAHTDKSGNNIDQAQWEGFLVAFLIFIAGLATLIYQLGHH